MLSICSLLFLFFFVPSSTLAIIQNVSITPADANLQFIPQNAWTVSTDSRATGGSFAHASAENATVVFTLTSPATAVFWHGFMPQTAARYSICIDCANVEALGSIVTIEAQSASRVGQPIILFASKALENTTHSIAVRNLRNPIEGVVGELSLDSFSFTTDVQVPASNSTPATGNSRTPSAGEIAGIVFASVIAAGILLGLAKCFATRRRQHGSPTTGKRPKIWRKPVVISSFGWKRHRRTTSSESSPIIEAVWKAKPLTAPELPIHNLQPARTNDTTVRSNNGALKPAVPAITITSPSTNSTIGSLYSSTHQDLPPTSPFKLSIYQTERGVRQSDPYASYATAYAAFAGIAQPDDDALSPSPSAGATIEEMQRRRRQQQQQQQQQQQAALRDSATLPSSQTQERILAMVSHRQRDSVATTSSLPPPPPPPSVAPRNIGPPPSAFKGQGIRDGKKGKRTLSDKIKRGTLPLPPQVEGAEGEEDEEEEEEEEERGVLHVSANLTVADPDATDKDAGTKEYVVEGDLVVSARPQEPKVQDDRRPSMIPTFSSGSSDKSAPTPPSGSPPKPSLETADVNTLSTDAASGKQRQQTGKTTVDPAYWSSYGDFSIFETLEGMDQHADSSSDGIHSNQEEEEEKEGREEVRRQSLQSRPSTSKATRGTRSSHSGAVSSQSHAQPFETRISLLTADTNHPHTNRSSLFSLAPSFSEFPMPPFKRASSTTPHSAGTLASSSDATTAFTDLLASTPSPSYPGSGARNHIVKDKTPPSAFVIGAQGRPKRSKAPSLRPLRDGPSAIIKSAQTGSGLGMLPPVHGQNRPPVRRSSSRSSKSSSRRRSRGSGPLLLPTGAIPPLPRPKSSQGRLEDDGDSQNILMSSENTSGSDIPLYMRMLPETPRTEESSSGAGRRASANPSRLTMGSTLTTTDEEYAGDVQLFVASRHSIMPELPRALAPSTAVNSMLSLKSSLAESSQSSDGKWQMVMPNDKQAVPRPPVPEPMPTGMSISTDRSLYRAVNVPISARTDAFDAGISEMSHGVAGRNEPSDALGTGTGMPWSPNFDWPASPSFNITTSDASGGLASASNQPPRSFLSDSPDQQDEPNVTSESTENGYDISQYYSDSRPTPSQGPMTSVDSIAWRDFVETSSTRRSTSRVRDSTYSTTSTFFGGPRSAVHSPTTIPPVPPIFPPALAAQRDSRMSMITSRTGWNVRSSASSLQSPIERPRPQRQRQTGQTAVGNVSTVFAAPQNAVTRPKLTIQRVDSSYAASLGTPSSSRYYSPYTAHPSPPSSAELLISKR